MNTKNLKPRAQTTPHASTRWITRPLTGLLLASAIAPLLPSSARAQAVEDDVVINEFTANRNANTGREYVELLVVKPGGVDMRGWTISDTSSRTAAANTTEGDVILPNADYLSNVPQGTHVVIVLTIPQTNPNILDEDLSNADSNSKLVLIGGVTPGVIASTSTPMDLSTNDNIQVYAGSRATGTLIDQVLVGTNTTYIAGAAWGDNNGTTTADNIPTIPNAADVRFVPAADSEAEFRNNDTAPKYVVDTTANTYGTPGAANTGVTEVSLQTAPGSLQFSAPTFSVNEDGGTATISVTRAGGVGGAVSVLYAATAGTATDGQDFTSTSGTISFADAEGGTKTFTVPILNDTTPSEPNETVTLTLSGPTGGATLGAQSTATLSIVDDDQPGTIQLEAPTVSALEGGTAIFAVTRTAGSAGAVSVPYTLSGGSATAGADFPTAFASGTLNFAAGQTRATIEVPITDDSAIEDNETATLQLGQPNGGAALGAQTSSALTIVETDRAPLLLINEVKADDIGADEPFEFIEVRGTPGALLTNIFVLLVNGPATSAGTVGRAYDLSGQRIGSNGLLIIKSTRESYTNIPAETTIVGTTTLDATNGLSNGAATFVLALFPPGTVAQGTDLDADNDGTLELPAGAQVADAIGYKNGVATDVVYGPELAAVGPQTTPTGTTDPPDEALEAITRFPGNTTPLSAAAFYGGALSSSGAATSNAYDTAQPVNLTANFPAGGAVTPGDVNAPAAVANTPPDAVDDAFTVAEDSGANTLQVLANDTDPDAGSTRTVTAVTQGAKGAVAIGAGGANVTYTPNANAVGSDTFTYTISDGQGGSDTATVTITITSIDDAPTLAAIANQTVAEDSGAQTVALSGIGPGGGSDEAAQTVSLAATSSDASIIANPTITGTGSDRTLSFSPVANASGTATITVTATDSGSGTAPNANTFARTFTITVTPAADAPDAVDDAVTVGEDSGASTLQVLANDTDADANTTLAVTAVTQGAKGTVAISPSDASVTYTPSLNAVGSDTFTYTISDGALSDTATVTITITPVNDAPDAVDDAFTVAEDSGANTLQVLANDTDPDAGSTRTVTAVTQGTKGTVAVGTNGANVIYTPNANANGSDSFTYTISDGQGGADTATVSITIAPANDAPDAVNDSFTLAEDAGAQTLQVLANDTDLDSGDTLSVSAVTQGSKGSVAIGAGGASVVYTPNANATGSDSFTYTITDGTAFDTATVSITITPVNDAPSGTADPYTVNNNGVLSVAAPGVLGNDSDAEGDALSAALVPGSGPTHGTLAFNANGSFSYDPDDIYVGPDAFSYTASDGQAQSAPIAVTIQVTQGPNSAPTISPIGGQSTSEDTATGPIAFTIGDAQTPAANLAVTATSSNLALVPASNITLGGSGASRTITLAPAPDQSGSATITVTVSDGALSTDRTFVLTVTAVNDAPSFAPIASQTVAEDSGSQTVAISGVEPGGGSDDASQAVTLTATSSDPALIANPTISGSGGSRTLSFAPAANASGTATITVTAMDSGSGAAPSQNTFSRTFTVTVTPVNDAPSALPQSVGTDEDTPLAITLRASDVDSSSFSFAIEAQPAHGTLARSGSPTGPALVYTPARDYVGPDSFSFRANDGTSSSAPATVSITVGGSNDAPSARPDVARTDEDTPVSVQVLANDTDAEGDALRVVRVATTSATQGTVSINPDGSLRFVPRADFAGQATFSYVVSDGALESSATVTVQVLAVNDAPVSMDQSVGTREDTPLDIALGATDIDGPALSFTIVQGPRFGTLSGSGATRRYTPSQDFVGSDSFTFRASDGGLESNVATVSITVGGDNDAPLALADSVSAMEDTSLNVRVLANDRDADGDALRLLRVSTSAATHGSVSTNADGSLRFVPEPNFNGVASFSYTITDGALEASALVTIQVRPVNDAPTAQDDAVITRADQAVEVQVLANDTDPDGDALTISTVNSSSPGDGIIISEDRRSVSFRPAPGFVGTTGFTYILTDGAAVSTARVTIQVLAADAPLPPTTPAPGPTPGANQAPRAVADSYSTRGPLQVLAGSGVLKNDTDAEGNPLRASLKSVPQHGTLRFEADGSFVYTPAVGYAGRDAFSYAANDGKAESATVAVLLQVTASPDVTPPAVALAGGAARTLRALAAARGSAADVYALRGRGLVVTSGLKSVVLQLQRADGQYWNGRAYQRAPFDLGTRLLDRSFFSATGAPPSGLLAPDGTYTWTAIATDNAGNQARAVQSVAVDSTPPSLLITTPQAGTDNASRVTRLDAVSGRAVGAASVEVALRRADGLYWNGQTYQSEPFFQQAALSGSAWSLSSGLPSGADLPPGRYVLIARARDEVGNAGLASRTVIVASSPAS